METLTWLQQFVARWRAKSPKGFAIVTNIALALSLITGIPQLLVLFGVDVTTFPPIFQSVLAKIVLYASIVGGVIAKVTVATPAATESVIKKINAGEDKEVVKKSVE